jgi:AcrR family transcriptional regulator
MLRDAVERSAEGLAAGCGPLARLAAAGRAYVACAVGNPGLFALMFRAVAQDPPSPRLRSDANRAFEQLLRHVRAAQDGGWQPGSDPRRLAGSVWASVHGLAVLWTQGALAPALAPASLDDALSTTLELALGAPAPEPARERKKGRSRR